MAVLRSLRVRPKGCSLRRFQFCNLTAIPLKSPQRKPDPIPPGMDRRKFQRRKRISHVGHQESDRAFALRNRLLLEKLDPFRPVGVGTDVGDLE